MGTQPFLIDDTARCWATEDRIVAAHLGTSLSGAALTRFVIENLGWVKIDQRHRAVRVTCRPALVSDLTLAAVLVAVMTSSQTVALDVLTREWQHFVLNRRAFVRFISSLALDERKLSPWRRQRFLNRLRSANESPLERPAALGSMAVRTIADEPSLRRALDRIYGGRWMLCDIDRERGHSVARMVGNAYTPFNPRWLANAEGETLCAYADDAYGLWVASHHRDVLDRAEAVFDDVDAVVMFPRIGDTRLRYSRLTLPVRTPAGGRQILAAAISDSSIDLRKIAG